MSKDYRHVLGVIAGVTALVLALGSGAYFGALTAHHHGNPFQLSAQSADGAEHVQKQAAAISDLDERAKRDLAAQEAMSVWSFWAVAVAAASALTTMVGTGFLVWQVKLTREAIDVNKDLLSTQMRAWISLKEWGLSTEGPKEHIGNYIFKFVWQNTGLTPAVRFTSAIGELKTIDKKQVFEHVRQDTSSVGPNLLFTTKIGMPPNVLFDSKKRPKLVKCIIEYDTVFPELLRRKTVSTFRISYTGPANLEEISNGNILAEHVSLLPAGLDEEMT